MPGPRLIGHRPGASDVAYPGLLSGILLCSSACGPVVPIAPQDAGSSFADASAADADERLDGAIMVLDPNPEFADIIVDAPGADEGPFGDPQLAVNGVRGAGARMGSTDVFSLGYETENRFITLRWSDRVVVDGPGDDFVVFENAFEVTPNRYFMDLLVVEVSRDGIQWRALPHDYRSEDETLYSADPDDWVGFAGRTPVEFHAETHPTDPFAAELAGGDAFDIASIPGADPASIAIRTLGFRYLRLTAAAALDNPDTGQPFPRSTISDGPDVDGVVARYLTDDHSL